MRGRAMVVPRHRYKRPLLIGLPTDCLDGMFSAIRRSRRVVRRYKGCSTSKDIAKGKENYFTVQGGYRQRVYTFTMVLMDTLRREGYKAHLSSYIQLDTEVSVTMNGGYEIEVWNAKADYFYTLIDSNAYSYYEVPLSMVPYLEGSEEDEVPIYTIGGLLRRLATFREALEAHHYCRTCYYSTEYGRYCGLGADPVGCTHYLQTMEDYDTTIAG